MEACFVGGCKLLGSFYQQHSLATDAGATFIGAQLGVRGSCVLAKALIIPTSW